MPDAHDRYGALAAPDERVHIDVIENPVQVALSAYKAWMQVEERNPAPYDGEWYAKHPTLGYIDEVYQRAASLLEPHAKAFRRVKPGELETILAGIPADEAGRGGFFLSALLNATELRVLDGVFRHKNIGYMLARGKRLVLREGSEAVDIGHRARGDILNFGTVQHDLGFDARGGIHLNWGKVRSLSPSADGGVRVNYGSVGDAGGATEDGVWVNHGSVGAFGGGTVAVNHGQTGSLSFNAGGGVDANYGTVKDTFAEQVTGGVQANYGTSSRMAWGARGGVQVNCGTIEGTMAYRAKWPSLQANLGTVAKNHIRPWDDWRHPSNPARDLQWQDLPRAVRLAERLDRKLKRLAPLAKLKDRPEEAYAWLRNFPYRAFEREILAFCRPLEERHAYGNAERMRL